MAKKNDYFQMFIDTSEMACQTAGAVKEIMTGFDPDKLPGQMAELHKLENAADSKRHELVEAVAKEFITPIEREDILSLANYIDDLIDTIEDVVIKLYMYNIQAMEEPALQFISIIDEACGKVHQLFMEFKNFRKSKDIKRYIIEINELEEKCDQLYTSSVRTLFTGQEPPLAVMAWMEIYSRLERCADACEYTSRMVENIMLKNS